VLALNRPKSSTVIPVHTLEATVISNNSPLEYLTAFAIVFVVAVIFTVGVSKRIDNLIGKAGRLAPSH
jgi:hypothetical protein